MKKSVEQLAQEYIEQRKLGSYGNEFDAFIAGFIACLENWKWNDNESTTRRNNPEAVSSFDVPRSRS